MGLSDRQKAYWQRNMLLTVSLLAFGAVVTFVPIYWVRSFNQFELFGWPLGFYMSAQGAIICYVFIVLLYAHLMEKLDRKYGMEERGVEERSAEAHGAAQGTARRDSGVPRW